MGDRTGHETLDIVCDNCGQPESQHTFAGGSMKQSSSDTLGHGHYVCDGYSQRKLQTKEKYAKSNK